MMNTDSLSSVSNVSLASEHNGHRLHDTTDAMPSGEMPPWGFLASAAILFLIGFFGFFLNLFVIVLMCKDIQVNIIIIFIGMKSAVI